MKAPFPGSNHTYFCDCGAKFRDKDPVRAHKAYKKHKETCKK